LSALSVYLTDKTNSFSYKCGSVIYLLFSRKGISRSRTYIT